MQDEDELDFRKKRQWTSFKASLYSALTHASFIGLLTMIVKEAMTTAGTASGFSGLVAAVAANPFPAVVAVATLAAGVMFNYLAQHEWTDLRVMEDEHLAQRNAECNALAKAKAKAQEHEGQKTSPSYDQNQRSDSKKWVDTIPANQNLTIAR